MDVFIACKLLELTQSFINRFRASKVIYHAGFVFSQEILKLGPPCTLPLLVHWIIMAIIMITCMVYDTHRPCHTVQRVYFLTSLVPNHPRPSTILPDDFSCYFALRLREYFVCFASLRLFASPQLSSSRLMTPIVCYVLCCIYIIQYNT